MYCFVLCVGSCVPVHEDRTDFLLDKRSVKTLKNSSSLLKPQYLLFPTVEYSLDLFPSILNSTKVSFDRKRRNTLS